MSDVSSAFWAILLGRLWPVLIVLALFVAGIHLARFLVKRWKAM